MLYSLGLSVQVRDWDLTTDAPYEDVAAALHGLPWKQAASGDHPFASSYRLSIDDTQLPIDIIGRFAIHSDHGICRLPALSSFEWQGIPMGSPEVWAVAYSLMGHEAKADKLFAYLHNQGAKPAALQQLLGEPLPDLLRSRLATLL